MASRWERCSGCGLQLVVPLQAQIILCATCNTITRFRPYNAWGQANDSLTNTAMFSYNTNRISSGPVSSYTGSNSNVYRRPTNNYHSQPPRLLSPLPSAYGRKRALLCGVSYVGKSYRLEGSINDVRCMKYFLVQKFGFPNDSIVMLTEDEANQLRIPTKHNMRLALRWLVQGCQSGDSLVFHYSGHGVRQREYYDNEVDGQDEALCPLDHETEGRIIDDEINDTIVRPLPSGVKLHAIIDACYSGTVLDLPFVCRMKSWVGSYTWEDQSLPACYKGTNGGLAISFSACDDDQTTTDTTAFTGNSTMTGAMTYSFIKAVQSEPGSTYGSLLNSMRYTIREGNSGMRLNGPIVSLVNKVLFNSNTLQEPQLSSSNTFDIYSTKFTL